MKYFLIAGEASGDLHGANLVRELSLCDPDAEIVCWGGELMEQEGARVLKHYQELAIMGLWEVIKKLGRVRKNLDKCKADISDFKPDLLILIDLPGFNLRIAGAMKNKIKNIYYFISPKIWAWKKSRINKIKATINRMYVIFPFETEFYRELGYEVKYFGNPVVETVNRKLEDVPELSKFRELNNLDDKPIVALLAGSRVQEVKKVLPVMVKVSEYYLDYQFVVAGMSSIPSELYSSVLGESGVKVILDQTYDLYKHSQVALVTSGTATLEAAIAGIPQVVCYRTSALTYFVARFVLNIRFISLVNIIMDKEIVKELIQHSMNPREIVSELNSILPGGWKRKQMLSDYASLAGMLNGEGSAKRVATDIYNTLRLVANVN